MDLKENLLYEIYVDGCDSDSGYDAGFFIAKDEENIVFQSVNSNGFDDGLLLVKTDRINRIEYNTKYCEVLKKLMEYRQTKLEKIKFKSKNLLKEVFSFAKNDNAIVGIELRNSDNTDLLGLIENISDEYITTLEIDYDGQTAGNGLARISDISKMTINEYKNLKSKILFDINSKSYQSK